MSGAFPIDDEATLTIGDLAERTGVSPATLRVWEQRHGFPEPHRLESGHRRYSPRDVAAVRLVVQRREAGVRLDVAIAQAQDEVTTEPTPPVVSVFAEMRRRFPSVSTHRLSKKMLVALSHALEDECAARSERVYLFGAFQHERFYRLAEERWRSFAATAAATFVFADFDADRPPSTPGHQPVLVRLEENSPMRREWIVVCDAPSLAVAMVAWEIPGQAGVREQDRAFDALWTIDHLAVRDAARVCARIAAESGAPGTAPVLYHLADEPTTRTDPVTASSLFNRVLAYADRQRL